MSKKNIVRLPTTPRLNTVRQLLKGASPTKNPNVELGLLQELLACTLRLEELLKTPKLFPKA